MAPASPPKRPALTVRAVIEQNDEILFIKAQDESADSPEGCWYFLPGGHVNHGETLEQALRREIVEEVGLEIDQLKPAFLREFIAKRHRRLSPAMPPNHHVIALIYHCKPVAGQTPRIEGSVDGVQGIDQIEWHLYQVPKKESQFEVLEYRKLFFLHLFWQVLSFLIAAGLMPCCSKLICF